MAGTGSEQMERAAGVGDPQRALGGDDAREIVNVLLGQLRETARQVSQITKTSSGKEPRWEEVGEWPVGPDGERVWIGQVDEDGTRVTPEVLRLKYGWEYQMAERNGAPYKAVQVEWEVELPDPQGKVRATTQIMEAIVPVVDMLRDMGEFQPEIRDRLEAELEGVLEENPKELREELQKKLDRLEFEPEPVDALPEAVEDND